MHFDDWLFNSGIILYELILKTDSSKFSFFKSIKAKELILLLINKPNVMRFWSKFLQTVYFRFIWNLRTKGIYIKHKSYGFAQTA